MANLGNMFCHNFNLSLKLDYANIQQGELQVFMNNEKYILTSSKKVSVKEKLFVCRQQNANDVTFYSMKSSIPEKWKVLGSA